MHGTKAENGFDERWAREQVRAPVLQVVGSFTQFDVAEALDTDDVFSRFGLSSMEVFKIFVALEQRFGVVIGESPTEFDRARTFGGLWRLIADKLTAAAAPLRSEP